jgi:hypothetical protein
MLVIDDILATIYCWSIFVTTDNLSWREIVNNDELHCHSTVENQIDAVLDDWN